MYMHDVLAKLKEIAETTDNRDINDAIKSAEMTQTSAYRGPQKEGPEPIVEEVHEVVEAEVAEAQSPAQKAAFKKMLAAKNGDKEEATEEDEKEDDDEEIQEIDDSLNDILRLSGQPSVLGEVHEADAATPEQINAFNGWFDKWNQLKSKDVYDYAEGIIQAATHTGVTELDAESDEDPSGEAHRELHAIFPEMDGNVEAIANKIEASGVNPTEPNLNLHDEVQEIDDSLNDILRLSGQSGVLGMSAPSVIIKESASKNPYSLDNLIKNDPEGEIKAGKAAYDRSLAAPPYKDPDFDPDETGKAAYDRSMSAPPYKRSLATKEDMDEEAVEETIEVPVDQLAELLRLAGQNEVTEEEFEPINAPKEVYGDAEEQLIAMSGGLNGPKNMYPTAAGGDNPMSVQPLDVTTESLYKKYEKFVAENNENV